jgi:hypothetical protein
MQFTEQQLTDALGDEKRKTLHNIYINDEGQIADLFIEQLFNTAFYGEEFDSIFQENFTTYVHAMLGEHIKLSPDLWTSAEAAQQWVTQSFGFIQVYELDDDTEEFQQHYAHCTHGVSLRCRNREIGTIHVFAPSYHNALLLSAIQVMRLFARSFTSDLIKARLSDNEG